MKKIFLPTIFASLLLLGAGCLGLGGSGEKAQLTPVSLEYWRTEDDRGSLADVIAAYRKLRPQVSITIKQLPAETYENELLKALAEDRGPDLFTLPNVELRAWQNKLAPMPKELTIQVQGVDAKKNITVTDQKIPGMTMRELTNEFVDAVKTDVVMFDAAAKAEAIHGLPLSLDTPALYYNKTLLARIKRQEPPKSWEDVRQMAIELTNKDAGGTILLSGASLGTATNNPYATEILASLMMQNGAVMANDSSATFDKYPPDYNGAYPPAVDALAFYTSFADKNASNYSWNDALPNTLDAFVAGKTALFIGFPADAAKIRELSPQLDFDIAPLPQINASKPAAVAHYPIETVSKKSAHLNEAWDFLRFMTAADNAAGYLTATKRPTALRKLITGQLGDSEIAPFVGQVFTAKPWYRGKNYQLTRTIFGELINWRPAPDGPDYGAVLQQAANAVNGTYY